jgi:hypothetical protein
MGKRTLSKITRPALGHAGEKGMSKQIKEYYEPIEPDWEKDVADAALITWKRLVHMATGQKLPEDAIPSPAALSIIDHEMRVLVNKLTENWH